MHTVANTFDVRHSACINKKLSYRAEIVSICGYYALQGHSRSRKPRMYTILTSE